MICAPNRLFHCVFYTVACLHQPYGVWVSWCRVCRSVRADSIPGDTILLFFQILHRLHHCRCHSCTFPRRKERRFCFHPGLGVEQASFRICFCAGWWGRALIPCIESISRQSLEGLCFPHEAQSLLCYQGSRAGLK